MSYNFKSSLRQGQKGEDAFHKLFPDWTRSDGRKEDFVMPNGKTVELKTERRTTDETPNLALELESSPGRPGAIQRAVADGIDYIIYYFADGKYFVYKPQELLVVMSDPLKIYRTVAIPNTTYNTRVLLVPRKDLILLEVSLDLV